MLGAIAGDVIGSVHEGAGTKTKDFPLFVPGSTFTDVFVRILEQVRSRYRFLVIGYVVMPEHFHLLMSKPEIDNPSKVMQVLKQRVARRLLPHRRRPAEGQRSLWETEPDQERHFWQHRF